MPGIDFAHDLNEEQLAAVTAPDGPVLVIAAAGTGKTRTLTYRVAYLVEQGVDPQRVLLLTFTNKAAREMLDRAQSLVGEAVGGLWGGTFHHMANRMLRRHADALGYQLDYTILDQDDARTLVKRALDQMNLAGKNIPKPDVLLSLFSYAANTERDVRGLAEERFRDHDISPEDIVTLQRHYVAKKRELNAMDFDDLLVNGLELFRRQPLVLERYRERFRYVMVDEYQDTNVIQSEWVDLLAAGHRNPLVVGDDFQSIYSWRGANFRNILSFPKRYPDAKVFKLETNYRSVPEILAVANACIAGNPEQFQKTLRPVRETHRPPSLIRLRDGDEQAHYVINRLALLKREGYRLGDVCVLYRSHFHAMEIQLELARHQIPYVITSGMRFFEQAHIKDVCSLVRVLANPGDALAFGRLLGLLPKLGPKTVAKLLQSLGGRPDLTDPDTLSALGRQIPGPARAQWGRVADICAAYRSDHLDADPGEIIHRFMKAFYDQYAIETFDNYDRRVEDIDQLVNFTSRFETAEAFLSELALLTNVDTESDDPHAVPPDALRLSTIHQAKGLEYPVVFVLWLADGMFPSGRSINDDDGEGESEERRLFYVAATRAKDELHLCVPALRRSRDGGVQYYGPSRFVMELPAKLMREDALHAW